MDIISEILDTDKQAEDMLTAANKKSEEIKEDCKKQINDIKLAAQKETEEYREKAAQQAKQQAELKAADMEKQQNEHIRQLENLYERDHIQWEKDILAAVLGG